MTTDSRRVLVTGGAGFIGSHVADAYLARGDEVWIVDDLSSGRRENVPRMRGSTGCRWPIRRCGTSSATCGSIW